MMTGDIWGAMVFQKQFEDFGLEHTMAPVSRVITCSAAEFMASAQMSPREFSATFVVPKRSSDMRADYQLVEDVLEAAWFGVPLEELGSARKRHYEERRKRLRESEAAHVE